MPFRGDFEKNVDGDDSMPGPAPSEAEDAEMDIKKGHPTTPQLDKKDSPPRFSTLFAAAPNPQPPPREHVQEYYPPPRRRAGVRIPTPLFVVFAAILFFESTILFAYTVIGLYNNAPSRLFPWAGPGIAATCDCESKSAAVNFAPNFVMPQAAEAITNFVTLTAERDALSSATMSSSTSTSTSTTSSSSLTSSSTASTESAALGAGGLLAGILGGIDRSSSSAEPPQTSVDGGKPITSIRLHVVTPTATLTSWVVVPAPTSAN